MPHVRRAVALAVLGIAVLTACERPPAARPAGSQPAATRFAARPLTVGFSQIGAESAWRTAETESVRSEAVRRGIELKFYDAQQQQPNQIKALRTFIAQKVDAIILAPVVEAGWEPVLEEARRAQIPVVLVDRGITVSDEGLYATMIGSDHAEAGRRAARFLAEKLGGQGNIAELQGTPGSAPAIERKRGFEEVIAQHPGMKIVKSQTGEFTRARGKEVMEVFLKARDVKIDALYAHNDDMALGAIQAIEAAGLQPGKDILIVSVDGVRGALEALREGKLNASIECQPLLGPAAFDTIEKILAGQAVPKKTIVEDQFFDQSVTPEVIAARKY